MSRTAQALAWIAEDPKHRTAYAAAQRFKLDNSVVYRALERSAGRVMAKCCPTCGAKMVGPTGASRGRRPRARS